MKLIYTFIILAFLSSCANPTNSKRAKKVQKFNFEIISHGFLIKNHPYSNTHTTLDYFVKVKVVNKSGYKLSNYNFYNKIKIVFPKSTFDDYTNSIKDDQYNPPWLPNDTAEFDFDFGNWNPGILEYKPDTVSLFLYISADDLINNSIDETHAYDIMSDWIRFQSKYKNDELPAIVSSVGSIRVI